MTTQVFGRLLLHRGARVLTAGGRNVELQARTFDLLAFLVASEGRVVSREDIQAAVWRGQVVVANNLTVQMSLLRRVLAVHGQPDAIQTVPGRGYRFVGAVEDSEAPRAPVVAAPEDGPSARGNSLWRQRDSVTTMGGLLLLAIGTVLGVSAMRGAPASFAAHVQVEAIPDEIVIAPEGYCHVDYRFRLSDPGELQLMTEDVRYHLTSGEPVSWPSVRGRIYHGSFPIHGPGVGVYHNNLYLPGKVVEAARVNGHEDAYLRHMFHLQDPHGHEVSVPAVVHVVFGTAANACRPGK